MRFRRPALPIADARRRTGRSSVRGGTAGRLRRVVRLLYIIFSAPARIYKKEQLGFLASQTPSRLRVSKIPRMKSVTDSNKKKPRARKDWTGFWRTIHAHVARPRPLLEARARPGEARRACTPVFFLLPLTHACKSMESIQLFKLGFLHLY
jgi:hypothetical protein